jgi:phenylalanyl-tRNA synthetase beta chain
MPVMEIAPLKENPFIRFLDEAKITLASLGMTEVITYPFTSLIDYQNLTISHDHPLHPSVELANPLVQDHSWMQTTGLIGLLKATERNHRFQKKGARLFEFGKGFHSFSNRDVNFDKFPAFDGIRRRPLHFTDRAFSEASRPIERHLATFLLDYPFQKKSWSKHELAPSFFDAKQIVDSLFKAFAIKGITAVRPSSDDLPFLHPTSTAILKKDSTVFGWLGELHPKVAHQYGFDITQVPVVCELDLEAVFKEASEKAVIESETFEFPHALRDLAFTVEASTTHGDIIHAVHSFKRKKYLESIELFDVFSGEGIPEGKKSMAYSLTFRAPGKTLQDQDVEKELALFMDWLQTAVGAVKR